LRQDRRALMPVSLATMIVLAVVVMVQPRAICHTPRMLHQIVGHLLKFRHGRSSLVEDDDLQRRCRVLASGASQRQGVNSRAQRKRTCPLKQLLSLRMPRKTMRAGQQPPVHAHWQVGASAQARDVAPRCRGRTRGKVYHLPACSLSQASRVLDNDIARGFFDGAATKGHLTSWLAWSPSPSPSWSSPSRLWPCLSPAATAAAHSASTSAAALRAWVRRMSSVWRMRF